MPRVNPRQTCKQCGGHRTEVGEMSARGRCMSCWTANESQNQAQLYHHQGPWFDHWRRRSAAAYGAILIDDLQRTA